jgi:hypothetical protein
MGRRGLRRHERQLQMGHNPIDLLILRYSGRSSAHPKSQAFDIFRVEHFTIIIFDHHPTSSVPGKHISTYFTDKGLRQEDRGKRPDGKYGSSGRTRTCNLVVTSAPEFLPGLDYLIALPECRGWGAGRFPRGNPRSTSEALVSAPSPAVGTAGAWLRIAFLRTRRREGFPEFTRFFNHDLSWKLRYSQPPALPIELPRSKLAQYIMSP